MTTMPGGDAAPLPLLVMAVSQEISDMSITLLAVLIGSTVGEAAAHTRTCSACGRRGCPRPAPACVFV